MFTPAAHLHDKGKFPINYMATDISHIFNRYVCKRREQATRPTKHQFRLTDKPEFESENDEFICRGGVYPPEKLTTSTNYISVKRNPLQGLRGREDPSPTIHQYRHTDKPEF